MQRLARLAIAGILAASSMIATAGVAAAAPTSDTTYTVKPGDHLIGIARKLSVPLAALLTANDLVVSSVIVPGQELIVPTTAVVPPPPSQLASYVVQPGDYLAGIALRHGVTLSALLRANDLELTSTIHPGQTLSLPRPTRPIPAGPTAPANAPSPATAPAPTTPAPEPAPVPAASPTDVVISYLRAQVGKPYEFNKAGPDSFDCSGLVVAGFAQVGIKLPHQSLLLSSVGTAVDWRTEEVRAGDLVFVFSSSTPDRIGHVGVALNSTTWIQAVGTGIPVQIRPIPADDRIRSVRRVIPAA
jgi:LysM repeat protein